MKLFKKWREKRAAEKAARQAEREARWHREETTYALDTSVLEDENKCEVNYWWLSRYHNDGDWCQQEIFKDVMRRLVGARTTVTFVRPWECYKEEPMQFPEAYYEEACRGPEGGKGLYLSRDRTTLCAVGKGVPEHLVEAMLESDEGYYVMVYFKLYAYDRELPETLNSFIALETAV